MDLSCSGSFVICSVSDFDTDEETDRLLEKQYEGNQYVDIPELTQPPVNRNLQVHMTLSIEIEWPEQTVYTQISLILMA